MPVPERVEYPLSEHRDQSIRLRDGRRLGYAEFGAPDGKPVLLFHGNPGSRLDAALGAVEQPGIRVIAPDRPGIGLSDFQHKRRVSDWPADVLQLSDALHIPRFALLGASAGTPYTLACAYAMPARITTCGLLSAFVPVDLPGLMDDAGVSRTYFQYARRLPILLRLQVRLMALGLRDPDRLVQQALASLPDPDRAALSEPHGQQAFLASMREALRQPNGLAEDAIITTRPWGFDMKDVTLPIHLWNGEADRNAPLTLARYIAQALPNCSPRFIPNEGHFSTVVHYLGNMLQLLVQ